MALVKRGQRHCGSLGSRRWRHLRRARPPKVTQAAIQCALVLIVEPRSQHRIDPDLVSRTLGLTPMESRIAVGLAEGKSVREMAEATGRTPGAITWHLKQIYRDSRSPGRWIWCGWCCHSPSSSKPPRGGVLWAARVSAAFRLFPSNSPDRVATGRRGSACNTPISHDCRDGLAQLPVDRATGVTSRWTLRRGGGANRDTSCPHPRASQPLGPRRPAPGTPPAGRHGITGAHAGHGRQTWKARGTAS